MGAKELSHKKLLIREKLFYLSVVLTSFFIQVVIFSSLNKNDKNWPMKKKFVKKPVANQEDKDKNNWDKLNTNCS